MAETPQTPPNPYGLHPNVAADFEEEDGPPMGTHTGRTNTKPSNPAIENGHGPKTTQAIRDQINRKT